MLTKIISGGQTGADRGGLEAGKALGIETGGTAPKGYRTETGDDISLSGFSLIQSSSRAYPLRTKSNVYNSDGTVIFGNEKSRGSQLTIRYAQEAGKSVYINPINPKSLREWIIHNNIKILNVAGNRESSKPGIGKEVKQFLINTLTKG